MFRKHINRSAQQKVGRSFIIVKTYTYQTEIYFQALALPKYNVQLIL